MPHQLRRQRFCSKRCWYRWHRGTNNEQTKRITITCDACHATFQKIPSHVWPTFNYCSDKCARSQHGRTITGPLHPNWRGGALEGRGPAWRSLRRRVIDRQSGQCGSCGMTEAEHHARYGRSFHVHHLRPYRLESDNAESNLTAVCIPCHGRLEGQLRRSLSAEERRAMQKRTERDQAAGLRHDFSEHVYDTCRCGAQKAKKALLCRQCRNRHRAANRLPHRYCACGVVKKNPSAARCWACHLKRRRSAA